LRTRRECCMTGLKQRTINVKSKNVFYSLIMREHSPFTPGNPVPIELFVGRSDEIKEVIQYLKRSAAGHQENIFLSGERGIGKSSLARYIRQLALFQENILAVHVHLGGIREIDGVVFRIFNDLLKDTYKEKWFEKIKDYFGKNIQTVDLFGLAVTFRPPKENLQDLRAHFAEALMNIYDRIKDERKGILIILDDLNGLASSYEFANWYKSLVDYIATHYDSCPITFVLIGLPEIRDSMSQQQESLLRIFRVVNIDKLSDEEVNQFFTKAFDSVHIKVEPKAMQMIVHFSGGLPLLMHEIGDAVFWENIDETIDDDDAAKGIIRAASQIGEKYINPMVYRAIRSKRYKSILAKIGENISYRFEKSEIEKKLPESEKSVFNNFCNCSA